MTRVALPRERFRDIPVPEIDSPTREVFGRDWFAKQGIHACDNTIVKSLNKLGYV